MGDFYYKDSKGRFVPIEATEILLNQNEGNIVVLRIGSDNCPVSERELSHVADKLSAIEYLSKNNDINVIIVPFQIDVNIIKKSELDNKCIYMQIISGDNISLLEEQIRSVYKQIKTIFDTVIMPTPLKLGEYKQIKDILRRSTIRKNRRGRAAG